MTEKQKALRYLGVDPATRQISQISAASIGKALEAIGLRQGEVDFGTLTMNSQGSGLAIIVYEFGLLEPPDRQHFFALLGRLYAGPALIYKFDEEGATISITDKNHLAIGKFVKWLGQGSLGPERAISAGICQRPQSAVNGQVLWQWPPG